VIQYLELYARHFQIDPLFGCRVSRLTWGSDGWVADAGAASIRARRVVVATGTNAVPFVPSWPGRERFRGDLVHSSDYRNGERFRQRRVLVVGFGNSAGDIAVDLHSHGARVALAIRGAVNVVPRDILGLPLLSVSIALSRLPPRVADALAAPLIRLTIGDIERLGMRKSKLGPLTEVALYGRIPLLDHETLRLIRAGDIAILGEVTELGQRSVHFRDGSDCEVDAIVAATGFRSELEHLLEPAELPKPANKARQPGSEAEHGLYFCGFAVSGTGMLRDIGIEARRIAHHLANARR
jgi:indole-3-pyruvate monooxygenase